MRRVMLLLGVTTVIMAYQNCAKTSFNGSESMQSVVGEKSTPGGPPTAIIPTITPGPVSGCVNIGDGNSSVACDPTKGGFTGNLYIQDRRQLFDMPHYGGLVKGSQNASIENFLNHPEWMSKDASGVPHKVLATGFNYHGMFKDNVHALDGSPILLPDSDGNVGDRSTGATWFALSMTGTFHLDPQADQPGDYQFAILADDGAQLMYQPAGQTEYVVVVDNQTHVDDTIKLPDGTPKYIPGTQWYRMGCTADYSAVPAKKNIKVFTMADAKVKIPLWFKYYQGPSGLGLQLMYRRVPADGNPVDPACALDTNDQDEVKTSIVIPKPLLQDTPPAADWKFVGPNNLN